MKMGYTILLICEGDGDKKLSFDLQNSGFSLMEAKSENECLSSIKIRIPQIIILDIKTQEYCQSMLKTLRAESELAFVPKIVVSEILEPQKKVELLGLGISDYIPRPFDFDELLARINAHLIQSLYNNKLLKENERLKDNSFIDEVSGMFNKKYLANRIVGEISRAMRTGESLSLVLIETNNYNEIVNKYGESAKNYVIKQVSQILKQLVRLSDILIRYGERRIAVLCPITNRSGVDTFAERLNQTIHDTIFEYNGEAIKFEVKIGAYTLESSDFNTFEKKISNLTEFAEEALERAIAINGDKVEFYD